MTTPVRPSVMPPPAPLGSRSVVVEKVAEGDDEASVKTTSAGKTAFVEMLIVCVVPAATVPGTLHVNVGVATTMMLKVRLMP